MFSIGVCIHFLLHQAKMKTNFLCVKKETIRKLFSGRKTRQEGCYRYICNQFDVILNVLITFADNFSVSFTISKSNCKFVFNNLKQKNLSSPLKVEIDQFVICLVLLACLSFKISSISLSDRDVNRDGVFCSFPASFRKCRPREYRIYPCTSRSCV